LPCKGFCCYLGPEILDAVGGGVGLPGPGFMKDRTASWCLYNGVTQGLGWKGPRNLEPAGRPSVSGCSKPLEAAPEAEPKLSMDFAMKARRGQTFPVAKLTGIVQAACASGALIGFARVSKSGFTRTFVGDLAVVFAETAPRRVQMLLAIAPQYHELPFLQELRGAVFSALAIPDEETWSLKVCPSCVLDCDSAPAKGYLELKS
jgi:hypothetical protein